MRGQGTGDFCVDWEQLIGCWGLCTLVRDMDAATGCRIVALVWPDFFLAAGERNGTREGA